MSKTTMTAAFTVMMATMALANAQTAPTTSTPPMGKATVTEPAARTAISTNHLMPGQIRATEMNGATVYDAQNQKLGDIKDIILDRDGRVAAVILNVGATLGMGGKFVAVAMNDVKVTSDNNKPRFTVAMTKDQLKAAEAYDLNEKTGTSAPPAERTR